MSTIDALKRYEDPTRRYHSWPQRLEYGHQDPGVYPNSVVRDAMTELRCEWEARVLG